MRNIVFDWSGTLADDLPPVLDATNRLLAHFGRPTFQREEFRASFRLPFRGFYEEVLPEIPSEDLENLFGQFFEESKEPVTLLPHAREFLEFAATRGARLFILSSARRDFLIDQARQLGVEGFFEEICAGVIDKRQELPRLMARRGLVATETAFIGDMEHDVETALASGVHAVAVLTGYDPPAKLMRAAPEITISHLGHLRRILQRQGPPVDSLREEVRVMDDFLEIEGLRVSTRIGAEKAERAEPQEVKVDVGFAVPSGLRDLGDDLEKTLDYYAVSVAIRELAGTGERRLIETLAEDVIRLLHEKYRAPWCRVRIRKYIIPETEWVAVVLESKIPGNEADEGQRLFPQMHECPQDA